MPQTGQLTTKLRARSPLMKRNLIFLAFGCVVLAMVAGSVFIGPPKPDASRASDVTVTSDPAALAPSGSATSGREPTSNSSKWSGLSVSSFGPVPGCGDNIMINTVVEILRTHMTEQVLGLANISVLGHSQVGDLVQWRCGADVQQGGRQQHLRYQISQEIAGRDSWQVTIMGVPSVP